MFLAKVIVDCRLLIGHSTTSSDSGNLEGAMILYLKTQNTVHSPPQELSTNPITFEDEKGT